MKISPAILALMMMATANAGTAGDLVGSIVPPYPEGLKDEGGACIAGSLGKERLCDFSVGVLKSSKGRLLYVGKSAERIDLKHARWLVTDVMPYPAEPKGHRFVFSNCERNGQPNGAILAVVKVTDTEWHAVISAFEVNFNNGRFEKTPAIGIRCYNEGWAV